MRNTSEEWLNKIVAAYNASGKDRWYTATCPVCGFADNATILSSDSAGKIAAKGKILFHIKMKHPNEIRDATGETEGGGAGSA